MNKPILPILLALLAATASLSVVLPSAHATGTTLAVSPSLVSKQSGTTFKVAIVLSNVNNLVGYDFTLNYRGDALTIVSVDSGANGGTATLMGSYCPAHCVAFVDSFSDVTGTLREAFAISGGSLANVVSKPLVIVTFQALPSGIDSPLTLSDALLSTIDVATGQSIAVIPTTSDGQFFATPQFVFIPPSVNVTNPGGRCVGTVKCKNINLNAYIMLLPTAPRASFARVTFIVTDPNSVTTKYNTGIVFLFPGTQTTLTLTVQLARNHSGNYHISGTLFLCAIPTVCAVGPTVQGADFAVPLP